MSKDLQEAMYLPYPMRSPTNTPTDTHNFLIRKLIRDMAHMMDPDEDYISIAATEQQTAATKAHRKKELEDAHANLKGSFCVVSRLTSLLAFYAPDFVDFPSLLITNTFYLSALSRVLEAARNSSTRPSTVPTAAQHASSLNDLDATRLSLAKAINDAESSLASKEAELASLKEEARRLEECDPAAEHERELNGTA